MTRQPPPAAMHHDGKLYLTAEEWDPRQKKLDAEKTSGEGSSNIAHCGGRKLGRGRGRGSEKSSSSSRPSGDECRKCGKLGHWA